MEKTFWTPYAFVMDCIALRIRLRSPSAVYFSVVAFPHFRRLSKKLDWWQLLFVFQSLLYYFILWRFLVANLMPLQNLLNGSTFVPHLCHICANAKKHIFAVNYDFCFECLVSPSADKIGTWLLEEFYVQWWFSLHGRVSGEDEENTMLINATSFSGTSVMVKVWGGTSLTGNKICLHWRQPKCMERWTWGSTTSDSPISTYIGWDEILSSKMVMLTPTEPWFFGDQLQNFALDTME